MYASNSSFTYQPLKGIYVLYYVLTTLICMPTYLILFIRAENRPRKSWSYKAAVSKHITQVVFALQGRIESKTTVTLDSGKDQGQFEVIDPAPNEILKKPLNNTAIRSAKAGGVWLPQRCKDLNDNSSRVILHFHGGAYVVLTPRVPFTQWGPKMFCTELPAAAAFSLQYRLASNLDDKFPAQLQDAIAAYYFLIKEKNVHPARIVLSGDSAGGHLAISLLRYLTETPQLLSYPQAVLLHHPWLDLTEKGTTIEGVNADSDYLSTEFLSWGARSFIPDGIDVHDPYISPLYHPFATKVPIWVQAGTAEFLIASIKAWVGEMSAIEGNRIRLHELPDAPHSVFAIGEALDMVDVALAGARSARDFLNEITVTA